MNDARIYLREDTIAAPSTPSGRGAIAIIRISGPDAITLCSSIFSPVSGSLSRSSREMIYGRLLDPSNREHVDDVLCASFPAPRSYTGENMAEIYCHGSEAVIRKTLKILYRDGARPAEPGEFTFRAVRNGKMDLAQAEAVSSLIDSRTQLARSLSLRMLEGAFSKDLVALKEELISTLVEIETQLEFPDEASEEKLDSNIQDKMTVLMQHAESLQKRAVRERRFEQGIAAVIAGRPNVGKSSLFNRLLGRERAIVTPHPGTTRDSIEGTIELEGRPVTLIDTAGLRETQEEIEAIGIQRSQELLSTSHIIIFVCDSGDGLTKQDIVLLNQLKDDPSQSKTIVTMNKCDLHPEYNPDESATDWTIVKASSIDETGINELMGMLEHEVKNLIPADTDSAYLISARQERILSQLQDNLNNADQFIQQETPLELPAEDLRAALKNISELDGSGTTPDIMSTIFSRFCIGK